jgi:hypothetical protein
VSQSFQNISQKRLVCRWDWTRTPLAPFRCLRAPYTISRLVLPAISGLRASVRLPRQHTMPRASTASLPVSGLFALAKPSGPTSMAVVENVKRLVARSRLFVPPDKLVDSGNGKGKGKRRHKHREAVKIGQGGTLDPLADGVLGVFIPRAGIRIVRLSLEGTQ